MIRSRVKGADWVEWVVNEELLNPHKIATMVAESSWSVRDTFGRNPTRKDQYEIEVDWNGSVTRWVVDIDVRPRAHARRVGS